MKKRLQHFPSLKVLESNTATADVLDVHKYCDSLSKFGQEFEDRFNDFDKLGPSVVFITKPFMEVGIGDILEQMAGLVSVSPVDMERK